jgi:tetratricopeptide (TPR) repeat protein
MKFRRIFLLFFLFLALQAWAVTLDQLDALIANFEVDKAETELRTLLQSEPENPEYLKRMGFVYVLRTRLASDEKARTQMVEQALAYLNKAKSLGLKDPLVDQLLAELPGSSGKVVYSRVESANVAMNKAEDAFAGRRYEEAVKYYRQAAESDPGLYFAPLYLGDAWLHQGDTVKACQAYDRAIAIDPDVETAYRYKGNALMKQGDVERALRSYASAVVAEPGSEMAWERGLQRWADATGAEIRLPGLKPAVSLGEDGKTLNVQVGDNQSPELAPWLAYGAARMLWREEEFAQRYPGRTYRRTLAEEVNALEKAAVVASELEAAGDLKPSGDLALLIALNEDGLLEPFVLFCLPDEVVRQDFRPYREAHREKMVDFLVEYGVRREKL